MTKTCKSCGAVFRDGRWTSDAGQAKADRGASAPEQVICPGCDRLAKHRVDGVVTLRSPLLDDRREEALNLIRRVADQRHQANVAARLVGIDERSGEIQVTTTDQHLAERIGKEFQKAYSGDLDIQWPKGEEFVRVSWTRG